MQSATPHLFDAQCLHGIKSRILELASGSQPLWGKMDVAQMFAHCVYVMQNALGEVQQKRKWQGYLFAPFIRHRYYSNQTFKARHVPSTFKIVDEADFEREQQRLLNQLDLFHQDGPERCKGAIHPMLGAFTPEQWAIGQYKHIDHHLRQFGV